MFSLATIQRMNSAKEAAKIKRRARALNAKEKGHPKDAEKGRTKPVAKSAPPSFTELAKHAGFTEEERRAIPLHIRQDLSSDR